MPKKTKEEKAAAKAKAQAAKAARLEKKKAEEAGVSVEDYRASVLSEAAGGESKAGESKGDAGSKAASDVVQEASITGVLTSRPDSRDVQITGFAISLYGKPIIEDGELRLNHGRRYGLIGQNGSGKSTLLSAIAAREIPIPDFIDIWHLHTEAEPSELTAMTSVTKVVTDQVAKIEAQMEKLMEEEPESPVLEVLMDRLDRMDLETLEARAGELLFGLGFPPEMMHRMTKDMSGGWRMRVALAQALLVQPQILLLDEPTNHLDLQACIWLEDTLAKYDKTLVVISHSADFLDAVCTNIMELTQQQKLDYYGGNFSTYVKTRTENRVNQLKRYRKEQDDIARLQHFIRTCGTYSNLVKQAQSKQKIIDKMTEAGLTDAPIEDPHYAFNFPECAHIPPPVMCCKKVSFSYSGLEKDYLYTDLDFGIDLDSRVALVGPNGAGKSTLLKLMIGELRACEGEMTRHSHLRIAYYNQHSEAQLDLDLSPIGFLQKTFPDGITTMAGKQKCDVDDWRQVLGRYGITGHRQTDIMRTMSDGLKTRVVFCLMGLQNPHILLLDEPTNHLDMECIQSLADAIKAFPGGMVLVSHDFRLLSQVAEEIWVCDNKTVTKWTDAGGIRSYKAALRKDGEKKLARFIKQQKTTTKKAVA